MGDGRSWSPPSGQIQRSGEDTLQPSSLLLPHPITLSYSSPVTIVPRTSHHVYWHTIPLSEESLPECSQTAVWTSGMFPRGDDGSDGDTDLPVRLSESEHLL